MIYEYCNIYKLVCVWEKRHRIEFWNMWEPTSYIKYNNNSQPQKSPKHKLQRSMFQVLKIVFFRKETGDLCTAAQNQSQLWCTKSKQHNNNIYKYVLRYQHNTHWLDVITVVNPSCNIMCKLETHINVVKENKYNQQVQKYFFAKITERKSE